MICCTHVLQMIVDESSEEHLQKCAAFIRAYLQGELRGTPAPLQALRVHFLSLNSQSFAPCELKIEVLLLETIRLVVVLDRNQPSEVIIVVILGSRAREALAHRLVAKRGATIAARGAGA